MIAGKSLFKKVITLPCVPNVFNHPTRYLAGDIFNTLEKFDSYHGFKVLSYNRGGKEYPVDGESLRIPEESQYRHICYSKHGIDINLSLQFGYISTKVCRCVNGPSVQSVTLEIEYWS